MDLSINDIDASIELVYTPVRKDGSIGSPKSIISDTIIPGKYFY